MCGTVRVNYGPEQIILHQTHTHRDTRNDSKGYNIMTATEQTELKRHKLDTEHMAFVSVFFFQNTFINSALISLEYTLIILPFILKISDRFSRNLIAEIFCLWQPHAPTFHFPAVRQDNTA
jgi:hypothetical protein